jgi:ABC-type branched-subunit amino acid transport system ATPase component/ABC-type branched-subunit amino acid transport system permease subunit
MMSYVAPADAPSVEDIFPPEAAWRSLMPILAVLLCWGAAAFAITNSYYLLLMTMVPVWAAFGLSWNLFSGYSGLISFGHAAFFGLGAYFVTLAFIVFGLTPWLGIPIAGLLGAVAALLIGLPTFRLRGHYFALAMLAYPLALLSIFEWLGYEEVTLPMKREAGATWMQFADYHVYVFLALALLGGAMLLTRAVERSRLGLALVAIRQNEPAAEAAGIDTLRRKLQALSLSGGLAALTGGFYAVILLVVTPDSVFGMLVSAQALTLAMFGGVGSVWGPIIGAVILIPLSELLQAKLGAVIPGIQGVVYGLAIVAVILLAREGLFWRVKDLLRRPAAQAMPLAPAATPPPAPPPRSEATDAMPLLEVTGPLLEVTGLSRAFGGLHAVQDVSFSVRSGEILGVIGPNGAGKTTLFNLLNGFVRPDAGAVLLRGQNILGQQPNRICRAGIGRTFQVVRPFARMTVADNVRAGAHVHGASEAEARALARAALVRTGIAGQARMLASQLTNLQLRQMELARALAGSPDLLLLDEPLAGLGAGEIEVLIDVVRRIAADGVTIVIIEHTLHAMVRLVDRFIVLDHGTVLATGSPTEVTQNPAVIEAYLGKAWAEHA